jgi:hypothetical protein
VNGKGLYVTLAATVVVALLLTALVVRPRSALEPLRGVKFDLDEPAATSTARELAPR